MFVTASSEPRRRRERRRRSVLAEPHYDLVTERDVGIQKFPMAARIEYGIGPVLHAVGCCAKSSAESGTRDRDLYGGGACKA
jgi:hypothetical protein